MEKPGLIVAIAAFVALAVVVAVETVGFRSVAFYAPSGEDRSATTTGMSMHFNSRSRNF